MGAEYNPEIEEFYIMYFDINNLYSASMSNFSPYSDFQWEENVSGFDVSNIQDDSPYGYILEVDLEYPEQLYDLHEDLPLCPEHFIPPGSKLRKSIPHLLPKTKYGIHYENFKYCLECVMKLTNIYRILKFKQSQWLKSIFI